MLLSTALGLFLGFWSLLYLIDFYFRTRNFTGYINFVERTGLVVTPFQIRWYTGRFQSWIASLTLLHRRSVRRFLDLWFSIGAGMGVLTLFIMVIFLSRTLWAELLIIKMRWFPSYSGRSGPTTMSPDHQGVGLIPVIPGVNVPWEQMPLFLLALVIAGVFHEFGHAMAAMNENVNVNGFGVFFVAIYPGAFTEIETDGLDSVSLFRKLKIYCGGIWHNFILALMGMALLWSLPYTMSSAYWMNKGVVVTDIHPDSSLHGQGGLRVGDVVYGINYCKVYNEDSWYQCINRLLKTNYGYCLPRHEVAATRALRIRNVHGELQCCHANSSQTHLCFYYKPLSMALNDTRLENVFEYSCLPARYVTDHYVCNNSLPCGPRTACVYAALFNSTKLLRFFVANHSTPVLFIGFPKEVAGSVHVSSFVPRTILSVWLPVTIELFCKYLITFSLALALLNSVPCYSLDGQFIVNVLLDGYGRRHRKWVRRRHFWYKIIMTYGTLLLSANVIVALWKFVRPFV